MTNYYSQATITPCLPMNLFSDEEIESLSLACGLSAKSDDGSLYFFAEECFADEGEDQYGETLNCLTVMQLKLRQLDASLYPCIVIQGATVCSKMRPDSFGGFAHLITRDEVRSFSTWRWLHEQQDFTGIR